MNRKTLTRIFPIFLILLFTLTISWADSTTITPTLKATPPVIGNNSDDNSITEFSSSEAYKLLYENAKENNDRMLLTIQWVIGISIAFLLAIFGGQIYFNWRINKKEIDYIHKDIEEKIGDLKAEFLKDIGQTNKEKEAELKGIFEKFEKEIKENVDENFEKKSKFIDLKSELNEKEIKLFRKAIENDLKRIKIDVEKNHGDIWLLKGVESNALSAFIKTALMQIETKQEVKYRLDDIIEVLETLDEIHISDYEELEKLTAKTPAEYSSKKSKIEDLYKGKPVYKFVEKHGHRSGSLANLFATSGLTASFLGNNIKQYVKNGPKIE